MEDLIMANQTFSTPAPVVDILTETDAGYSLTVWNDDINTFDWVMETLVDVCAHSPEQAEQCSLLIHYKGKCIVKKGELHVVQPMCEAILDRHINATIDALV